MDFYWISEIVLFRIDKGQKYYLVLYIMKYCVSQYHNKKGTNIKRKGKKKDNFYMKANRIKILLL